MRFVFVKLSLFTKQKWQGCLDFVDLYVKQKVAASGQSAIIVEIFE